MIEDCFEKWYRETYPNLDPKFDEMLPQLLEAYISGWKRAREIEEALTELAQKGGEYD